MYMNVIWGRIKAGMFPEYERIFLQPDASPLNSVGFICRWLLRDLDDANSGFTLSLWESKEALNSYQAHPTIQDLRENMFKDLFVGEFSRYACEVRVASPGALNRIMRAPESAPQK
jgi:heme-degrading monooxygenase HmoA